mgnify:CR=1 FL=1
MSGSSSHMVLGSIHAGLGFMMIKYRGFSLRDTGVRVRIHDTNGGFLHMVNDMLEAKKIIDERVKTGEWRSNA